MLVKRNATLMHEFFVSSLEEVDQLSKLSPLHQGGHEKFLLQSCVSFYQHCRLWNKFSDQNLSVTRRGQTSHTESLGFPLLSLEG